MRASSLPTEKSESCFSISVIFNTEGVLILPFFMYLDSNCNFYQEFYFLFFHSFLFLSFLLFQFSIPPFEAEFSKHGTNPEGYWEGKGAVKQMASPNNR